MIPWLVGLALAGSVDLRWLEDPEAPEVEAWRDEHTEATLDWLGHEAVAERTEELVRQHEARDHNMVALDDRAGTTVWERYQWVDLTPEELAARADHDRRTGFARLQLFAQREGEPPPGQPLQGLGSAPRWPLCDLDISDDGARVVWRRRRYEAVPLQRGQLPACHTWVADLETQQTWYLGMVRGSVRFAPGDASVLWLSRADRRGHRTRLVDVDAQTGQPLRDLGTHRGLVWRSRLPDGRELWSSRRGRRRRLTLDGTRLPLPRQRLVWAGWHEGDLILWHHPRKPPGHSRIVRVDPDQPRRRHWEELAASGDDERFATASVHLDTLLLGIDHDGSVRLEERSLVGDAPPEVPLGDRFRWLRIGRTLEDTTLVRGFLPQGARVWRRDAEGRYHELEGPRYADHVVFETLHTTASDGTELPLSVQRPRVAPEGPGPVWVQVYGGFGQTERARGGLVAERFVARGGTIVTVHARGGSERGEAWHEAARKRELELTMRDVHDAVRALVDQGVAEPGRIAISGGSNGGLTAVATMLREPDLFGAVITTAGVLDLLRGPAMGKWWPEEYGSPTMPAQREVLARLSPVHAEPSWVPPILVVTGQHDPTVTPSHSYKLVAAWEEVDGGPVLLRARPYPTHAFHLPDKKRREAQEAMAADATERAEAELELFLERALSLPPLAGPDPGRASPGP